MEAAMRKRAKRAEVEAGVVPSVNVVPILNEEVTQGITLVDAFASVVTDKKYTSKLVKELSERLPLGDLIHLKRVKKTSVGELLVLLCPVEDTKEITLDEILQDKPITRTGLGELQIVKVPSINPRTRRQFEEGNKYWPESFHEDKRLEQLLRGDYFSNDEVKKIENYSRKALEAAAVAKSKREAPVGAVIVDPKSDQIIAVSHSRQSQHPLHHAVMVAVDLVGMSQGGGAYQYQDSYFYHQEAQPVDPEDKTGPYLCTGYDLYVSTEPCVMCAMALVHSRINRVFYVEANKNGALGSRYKLHTQNGLNHHYEVFRIEGLEQNESGVS